jgi:hypothetical protein
MDRVWLEVDTNDETFPGPNTVLTSTDLTLTNPKPIGNNTYIEYTAIMLEPSGNTMNLAGSAAGVTYRTLFKPFFGGFMGRCPQ